MKEYKIKFSIKGFLAFVLIMIPNIIWMIIPPSNDFLASNSSDIVVLNVLMTISQWIMIALLMILVRKTEVSSSSHIYKLICIVCLGIYYISWVFYYMNIMNQIMFLGMAVIPCSFFIIFIIWQKIYLVLVPAIIFAVLHIGITFSNVM